MSPCVRSIAISTACVPRAPASKASGGVGQVAGVVIGAFIMGVMNNGMSIMGVNIDWQQMIKGVVLLAAVFFDLYNKNRSA